MLRDLLRIRRWAVDARPFGGPTEATSWHFTQAGAWRRKRHIERLTASQMVLHTVRHHPRPIPGLFDATAAARHHAPRRPA